MAWSRDSRHERGYGSEWDRLRAIVLERDDHLCRCPACRPPGGKVRLRAATEVDHIKPKAEGGTDELENLRAVNEDCHRALTIAQQGKKRRKSRGVSVDGWPLDPDHPWNIKSTTKGR
ncbi:MAG TPA: HNH endonuclease signature motif containing protein [Burkholderiales bacterium]|nr:HNH endonuclease signature motif containing protein [Burkholderiales bacterium]